jgi:hypothetical protein
MRREEEAQRTTSPPLSEGSASDEPDEADLDRPATDVP